MKEPPPEWDNAIRDLARAGARARRMSLRKAAFAYRRALSLPALLPLRAHELQDVSEAACRRLIERLKAALRRQRRVEMPSRWLSHRARERALWEALAGEINLLKGAGAAASAPRHAPAAPGAASVNGIEGF